MASQESRYQYAEEYKYGRKNGEEVWVQTNESVDCEE